MWRVYLCAHTPVPARLQTCACTLLNARPCTHCPLLLCIPAQGAFTPSCAHVLARPCHVGTHSRRTCGVGGWPDAPAQERG